MPIGVIGARGNIGFVLLPRHCAGRTGLDPGCSRKSQIPAGPVLTEAERPALLSQDWIYLPYEGFCLLFFNVKGAAIEQQQLTEIGAEIHRIGTDPYARMVPFKVNEM